MAASIRARPPLPLLLVCLIFAAASLVAVPVNLGLGWDEVVYVSQYGTHAPAAFMSAPRAWGVTLLVGPVAAWTDSVVVLRLYLTLTATIALGLAYWPWARVLGRPLVAALAAGFYASLWISLFYADAAMPNHYTAMAAVGAAGCLLLAGSGASTPAAHAGLVAALVVAGLMRPTDAFMLGLALLVAILVVPALRRWRLATAVLVGLGLGVVPWVIEAYARFGGLLERLRQASEVQGGTGLTFSLAAQVRTLDGPLLCRPCDSPLRWPALLWWVALTVLVPVGVWAAHRVSAARTGWLPVAAAASMAFPYIFLIGYSAPRFLLAAYALLLLPTAGGLAHLLAAATGLRRRALVVAAIVGLVGHVTVQAGILTYVANNQHREDWTRIAAILDAHGVRPPCVVTGTEAIPIAYYARCGALEDDGNNRNASTAGLLSAAMTGPFALVRRNGPAPPWALGWRSIPMSGLTVPGWTLYLPPADPQSKRLPAQAPVG